MRLTATIRPKETKTIEAEADSYEAAKALLLARSLPCAGRELRGRATHGLGNFHDAPGMNDQGRELFNAQSELAVSPL